MRQPKIRGKPRPMRPPLVQVRAGAMQVGVTYRIHYRTQQGTAVASYGGTFTGQWSGETTPAGLLIITRDADGYQWPQFSFPSEIRSLRRIDREPKGLDAFVAAYVKAALWSSTGDDDQPLDDHHGPEDIAPATLRRMREECRRFLRAHRRDIGDRIEQAGHDFWLDRNGHGAGAQDGHWPEDVGDRLAEAARNFGTFDLSIGDDGRIHGS